MYGIGLCDELQVRFGTATVTAFGKRRAGSVLAYLALHPGKHNREKLLELFWPELELDAGRHALSMALSHLRDLLEKELDQPVGSLIRADRTGVGLASESYTTDIASITDPERLLPGYYDDWVLEMREGLRQQEAHRLRPELRESLPAALTPYIGNTAVVEQAQTLLRGTRLLTIVGPGGVGKTRLALEVLHAHPGSVAWVELAALTAPEGLAAHLTSALGLAQPTQLLPTLRQTPLVLGLDNGEHLIEALTAQVTRLLRACPSLIIIVTSREPLQLPGETLLRLTGLPEAEAVALFCERAQRVAPGWCPSAEEETLLKALCQKLDGLPLALELAAAKLRTLSLSELAQQLETHVVLLATGSRSAELRQRTLRGMISWSYELLSEAEALFFTQLAVFQGGWTAARAGELSGAPDRADALLEALIDKSLVLRESSSHGPRYRFLETIRSFALEQLHTLPPEQQAALRHRHLQVYYTLIQQQKPKEWHYDNYLRLSHLLDPERENFRQALEFCREALPETFLAFVRELGPCLGLRGRHAELRQLLHSALALPEAQAPSERRENLLKHLCDTCMHLGDWEGMEGAVEQFMETRVALGLPPYGLEYRAMRAMEEGHLQEAEQLFKGALEQAEAIDTLWAVSDVYGNYSQLHLLCGDLEAARAAVSERQHFYGEDSWVTINRGLLELLAGNLVVARENLKRAVTYYKDCTSLTNLSYSLIHRGMLAVREGEYHRAAQLFGASFSWSEQVGVRVFQPERSFRDRDLELLRSHLESAPFEAAFQQGYAWTYEEALAQLDF